MELKQEGDVLGAWGWFIEGSGSGQDYVYFIVYLCEILKKKKYYVKINKNKEKYIVCGIKIERDFKGVVEWMRGGS